MQLKAKLSPVVSVVEGKSMREIEIFIISERNKYIGECGGLSYGESWSTESYGAGATLFHINQPEGNDGGGSDYRNTPSPHLQDLCPG